MSTNQIYYKFKCTKWSSIYFESLLSQITVKLGLQEYFMLDIVPCIHIHVSSRNHFIWLKFKCLSNRMSYYYWSNNNAAACSRSHSTDFRTFSHVVFSATPMRYNLSIFKFFTAMEVSQFTASKAARHWLPLTPGTNLLT